MGLKDLGETLPPGFRFNPSDEELVCHYLYKKIANEEVLKGTLVEIDLHTCEPWQLPDVTKLNASEWYFFSFRDRKYATGYRTNRATTSGYWKATGKDRVVLDPKTQRMVGMRKTLVFYQNRAPNGVKTPWIMHEFRLETPHMPPKEDWVLCRVFYKAKGDTNMATSSSSPPLLDAYTVGNTCECRIQTLTQNPNVVDPTLLNHSTHLLQLLKEGNATTYTITNSSRIDDDGHDHVDEAHEYEFLWIMGIYEAGLTNGGNRHNGLIGDTGFEDGNGIVLL